MKRPFDYQMAIADAEGATSDVAARFGIHPTSVLQVRVLVREYREREALVIAEEELPLAERRVEFMPLLRRTRNVLRRESIEMGADLLGLAPGAVLSFRSAGKAVNADVQRYLDQQGCRKRNGRRRSLQSHRQTHPHDTLADGAGCGDGVVMIEPRKKLSLRLAATPQRDEAGMVAVLTQAMTARSCVSWTYNRTTMRASPQILYWRNDALHCDAVVIERNGAVVAEPRLGAFRLSGLDDVALAGKPIGLSHDIDIADERYRDGIFLRITD